MCTGSRKEVVQHLHAAGGAQDGGSLSRVRRGNRRGVVHGGGCRVHSGARGPCRSRPCGERRDSVRASEELPQSHHLRLLRRAVHPESPPPRRFGRARPREDRPSHGASPPSGLPPLLPKASRTTHGGVLNENFIINEFKCDKRKMRTIPAMGRREVLVVAKMVGIVEGTEIQELS